MRYINLHFTYLLTYYWSYVRALDQTIGMRQEGIIIHTGRLEQWSDSGTVPEQFSGDTC